MVIGLSGEIVAYTGVITKCIAAYNRVIIEGNIAYFDVLIWNITAYAELIIPEHDGGFSWEVFPYTRDEMVESRCI